MRPKQYSSVTVRSLGSMR